MSAKSKIQSLTDMIQSCFTYGGAERNSYNFERYIQQHEKELGTDLFNSVYEEYLQQLKDNFEIKYSVYTDCEGCTYNSLIPKEQ